MKKIPFRGYCLNACGNPVFSRSLNAKYCSEACAKLRFQRVRGSCLQCNKPLPRVQYKYCSNACQHEHQFHLRIKQLEAGECRTNTSNRFIRRYLVERFGEKCANCGWAERHPVTGKVPVEVEHIDGDWRNNCSSNLTLLCPNCHSLTPTYRALNWGRGRPMRLGGRGNPLGASKDAVQRT